MSVLDLARPEIRTMQPYSSARMEAGSGEVFLNANESAWPNPADTTASSRRYPDPQPVALRAALAALYGCEASQLLIGRGSDEAIDLLVRALCNPGKDAVVITPPVFGMYAVCARLQNAPVVEVPLREVADGLVFQLMQHGPQARHGAGGDQQAVFAAGMPHSSYALARIVLLNAIVGIVCGGVF